MDSKPMYVFSSREIAIEIGRQIDRGKNNYLSRKYVYFDGNEKRVLKTTTLSLSIYHPLFCKKIY